MAEQDLQEVQLPLASVGVRLVNARKAAGLTRSDLAAHTRIAERHLAAIEEGRFSDLASRAYAVGFSRAYARAVGLDEAEIVQAVRDELATSENAGQGLKPAVFEPGDPARIPGLSLTGAAALGVVLVAVLIFVFWRSYYVPAVSLPDLTQEQQAPVTASPVPSAPVAPAADAPVVFTALAPNIWVKFYDSAGKQLMQKQMAQGERYQLPPDAQDPRIWTAQPDALQITIGGKVVPPLADKSMTIKDVQVSAASLLARQPAAAVTAAVAAPSPSPSPLPVVRASAPVPKPMAPQTPATASAPSQVPALASPRPHAVSASRSGDAATAPAAAVKPAPSASPAVAPKAPRPSSAPASGEAVQASTVSD